MGLEVRCGLHKIFVTRIILGNQISAAQNSPRRCNIAMLCANKSRQPRSALASNFPLISKNVNGIRANAGRNSSVIIFCTIFVRKSKQVKQLSNRLS